MSDEDDDSQDGNKPVSNNEDPEEIPLFIGEISKTIKIQGKEYTVTEFIEALETNNQEFITKVFGQIIEYVRERIAEEPDTEIGHKAKYDELEELIDKLPIGIVKEYQGQEFVKRIKKILSTIIFLPKPNEGTIYDELRKLLAKLLVEGVKIYKLEGEEKERFLELVHKMLGEINDIESIQSLITPDQNVNSQELLNQIEAKTEEFYTKIIEEQSENEPLLLWLQKLFGIRKTNKTPRRTIKNSPLYLKLFKEAILLLSRVLALTRITNLGRNFKLYMLNHILAKSEKVLDDLEQKGYANPLKVILVRLNNKLNNLIDKAKQIKAPIKLPNNRVVADKKNPRTLKEAIENFVAIIKDNSTINPKKNAEKQIPDPKNMLDKIQGLINRLEKVIQFQDNSKKIKKSETEADIKEHKSSQKPNNNKDKKVTKPVEIKTDAKQADDKAQQVSNNGKDSVEEIAKQVKALSDGFKALQSSRKIEINQRKSLTNNGVKY